MILGWVSWLGVSISAASLSIDSDSMGPDSTSTEPKQNYIGFEYLGKLGNEKTLLASLFGLYMYIFKVWLNKDENNPMQVYL